MTPEQIARLQEIKENFERSWRLADSREATHRDVAYAKIEMLEAIAHIFGIDLY